MTHQIGNAQTSNRLLAHAHFGLDGSIESADLDPLSFSDLLQSFCAHDRALFPENAHALQHLSTCQKWAKKLEENDLEGPLREIAERGERLAPSESLLIPGGWRGSSSAHPMLYFLLKTEKETYDFYVISSEWGLKEFHEKRNSNGQEQFLLARAYVNVPKNALFYKKDKTGFFKPLLSFLIAQKYNAPRRFDPKWIYEGALARLFPYHNDQSLIDGSDLLFLTLPKGGNGPSFKLIKAFIRFDHFLTQRSKEEYKKWTKMFAALNLGCYFHEGQSAFLFNQETTLLEAMARKVARKFSGILKEGQLFSRFFSEVIREAIGTIQQSNPPADDFPNPTIPAFYVATLSYPPPRNPLSQKGSPPPIPHFSKVPRFPLILKRQSQPLCAQIDAIVSHYFTTSEKSLKSAPRYLLHLIDTLAETLPLKREGWKSPEDFSSLHTLLMLYCRLSKTEKTIAPRTFTTVLTLYYGLWALFSQTDDKLNETYFEPRRRPALNSLIASLVPPDDLFQGIDHSLFFMMTNPKEQKRLKALREALHGWERETASLMIFGEKTFEPKVIVKQSLDPEHLFYRQYLTLLNPHKKALLFFPESQSAKRASERSSCDREGIGAREKAALEIFLLATEDVPWERTFSPFALLRTAHALVGAFCYHRELPLVTSDLSLCKREFQLPHFFLNATASIPYPNTLDDPYKEELLRQGYGYDKRFSVEPPTFTETFVAPLLPSWIRNSSISILKPIETTVNGLKGANHPFLGLPPLLESAACFRHLRKDRRPYNTFSKGIQGESAPRIEQLKNARALGQDLSHLLKEVASLTSHNARAAYNLLSLYSQHASYLKDRDHQIFLMQQLFKLIPSDSKTIAQIGMMHFPKRLPEVASHFANALEALAFEGKRDPDHQLFLFGSYIISTLFLYHQGEENSLELVFKKQKNRIDETLQALKFAPGEKSPKELRLQSLYHLHALYHLVAANDRAQNTEGWIHYFSLEMLPDLQNASSKNSYLFLEQAVLPYVHFLVSQLSTLSADALLGLTQDIALGCGVEAAFASNLQLKDATHPLNGGAVELIHESKETMTLQYITGQIYLNGDLLRAFSPNRREGPLPTLAFGKEQPFALHTESRSFFSHCAGRFEMVGDALIFHYLGKRLIFHPSFHLEKGAFFQTGYQHFYDPEEKEWIFFKERQYRDPHLTLIYKEKTGKIHSLDNANEYAPFRCAALEKIESPAHIYQKVYVHTGKADVEVPRYGLRFTLSPSEGKLRWAEDPAFFIAKNALPPKTLCVQEQSLLLKNDLGEEKLLVPRFEIKADRGFTRNGAFEYRPKAQDPSALLSNKKLYSCYTILRETEGKGIRLIPLTLEGRLDLAYYSLYDRNFYQFDSLLKAISPCEQLDPPHLIPIVKKIFNYGDRERHHSVEVSASILRLGMLFYRTQKNARTFFDLLNHLFPTLFEEVLAKHYTLYCLSKKELNESRRLGQEEEKVYAFCSDICASSLTIQKRALKISSFAQKVHPQPSASHFLDISFNPSKHSIYEALATSQFSQIYRTILQETGDLEVVETDLHLKLCMERGARQWVEVALLCLAAKKAGKTLPPFTCQPAGQESKLGEQLRGVLKGATYRLCKPMWQTIFPINRLEKEEEPCTSDLAPYYPPNRFNTATDDRPLFEKIGVRKEPVPLEVASSLRLAHRAVKKDFPFLTSLEEELKGFNLDMEIGAKRLAKDKGSIELGAFWKKNPGLKAAIQKRFLSAEKRREKAQNEVLKKVNRYFDCSFENRLSQLHIEVLGKNESPFTIRDLESIALWGEGPSELKRAQRLCPDFKNEAFQQEVWDLLLTYEIEAVYALAYRNALWAYEQIETAQDPAEKEVYCAELATTLQIHLQELASSQDLSLLELLIFVRNASLFPRKDQLEGIDALSEGGRVLQKIMGRGKTSVIAAIWAFKQARHRKKLPTIFAESSLYSSLIDDLKMGQYTPFQHHIFTINPSYAELNSLPEIEKILKDLREGFEKKWVLVMKGETLQLLDLALQKTTLDNLPQDKAKREVLRNILNFFKQHVSALADEVDLILRADFEVNVPAGKKELLFPSRIDLVRKIFTFLGSHPSLGILEEAQGLCSPEKWQKIFKELAQTLIDYEPLEIKEGSSKIQEGFCTYLVGKKEDPIPEPLKAHVDRLRQIPGKEEASALIALARHLVSETLPFVFKQSPGLHFGRSNGPHSFAKVVPFAGVDTPSTRDFGNPYEWLCKQFITAIIKGIDRPQLNQWINPFVKQGELEVALRTCLLKETRASKKFKEITGQDLEDPDNRPQFLNALLERVGRDLHLRLKVEADLVREEVGYYPRYYNSSAQSLGKLVACLCGMTGTPWNWEGFSEELGELIVDSGAEGQISQVLLQRQSTTQVRAIEPSIAPPLSMQDLLNQIETVPDVLLDMGAFLKRQPIEESARLFLKTAQNRNRFDKKGVLFFSHQLGEKGRDRLALGRFMEGQWSVEFLENTRESALKNKGLTPRECLTFFDQRHTTGIDLPLPLNARALITASEHVEMRTLLQTVMRLRRFCWSQSADFALLKPFYHCLKGGEERVEIGHLLFYALKQQVEKKGDSNYRSYKQKIDAVFIEAFRSHIRKGEVASSILAAYALFQPCTTQDDPYAQFFCQKTLESPIKSLKGYASEQLSCFKKKCAEGQSHSKDLKTDLKTIEAKIQAILYQVENKKNPLPHRVPHRQTLQHCEMETQGTIQTHREQQKEVTQELNVFWSDYKRAPCGKKRTLNPWWKGAAPKESVEGLICAIKTGKRHPSNLLSAPAILKKVNYKKDFSPLFPDTIFMTDAMQRSDALWLSIFDASQKIADSILIVKWEGGYRFVIVSQEESEFLKIQLEGLDSNHSVWLVDPKGGSLLEQRSSTPLLKDKKVREGLVYCSLFVGRASPITAIDDGLFFLEKWLKECQTSKEDKRAYLKKRSLYFPHLDQFAPLLTLIELEKE